MIYTAVALASLAAFAPVQPHAVQPTSRVAMSRIMMQDGMELAPPIMRGWTLDEITPDRALAQRVEGRSRRTWKFNDVSKDRVQVAAVSEGRPINSLFQLWIGPDWTPFTLKAYTEDGARRPIQTIIGTRNRQALIEMSNAGESEFPFSAAANYATEPMAALPAELPASNPGKKLDGQAVSFFTVAPETQQLEVVLKTDGRQLNARIEVLSGPNNPKQTYEVMTQNGMLNSLAVSMNLPGAANTVRIVNLATIEFPLNVHFREIA